MARKSYKLGNYIVRGTFPKKFMSRFENYHHVLKYSQDPNNGIDVQFRGGYIDLYFNGGRILGLNGDETCEFDSKYFYLPSKDDLRISDIEKLRSKHYLKKIGKSSFLKNLNANQLENARIIAIEKYDKIIEQKEKIINRLKNASTYNEVAEIMEEMKSQMTSWKNNLKENGWRKSVVGERMVQHYISLFNKRYTNNCDYVVLDIEYALSSNSLYRDDRTPDNQPRIDIVAIEKDSGRLYTMELKYGMKSVDNEAGIKPHYVDYTVSVGSENKWKSFRKDIEILLKAKQKADLVDNNITIADEKPEFAFIMKCEKVSDVVEFEQKISDEGLQHVKTIYLEPEKDWDNPSQETNTLSKSKIYKRKQ